MTVDESESPSAKSADSSNQSSRNSQSLDESNLTTEGKRSKITHHHV